MILECCVASLLHLTSEVVKSDSDKTAKLWMTSYLDLSHIPYDKVSTVHVTCWLQPSSINLLHCLTDRDVMVHDRSELFGNWFANIYKQVCIIRVLHNEKMVLV